MSEHITQTQDGFISVVTFDRREKKNAMTQPMYRAACEALDAAAAASDIRVVVFRAEGNIYCAGNDLNDFLGTDILQDGSPVHRFLRRLATFPKPLLAAVQGPAVGVGATMLLHCDGVYATDRALLSFPFTKLGVVPEAGSTRLLPALLGVQAASAVLLSGGALSAQEGHRAGLIQELVDASELDRVVMERAQAIAALPPASVRRTKELIRGPHRDAVLAAIECEADVFGACLEGEEASEAIGAMLERRMPDFSRFS